MHALQSRTLGASPLLEERAIAMLPRPMPSKLLRDGFIPAYIPPIQTAQKYLARSDRDCGDRTLSFSQ